MMRRLLTILGHRLWWLLVIFLSGQRLANAAGAPVGQGEPIAQYFSPRDYHGGTQCLCATQDARGVMYIGSLGMVLEYDGSTWRKISVESNFVSGLSYDAGTDTVFVGAENNLGYLKPSPEGGRVFVSLLAQLPADAREVGGVYGVHVTREGIFFVGTTQVMRWRDGSFKSWKLATTSKLRSNWTGGHLYICSQEVGLLRLEGDALATVSDDPFLSRASVRSILALADGTLLVGTIHEGLLTLRDGVIRPAEGECSAFLKEKGIFKMLRLHDGSLAIVTDTAGLLVVDAERRFRSHLDGSGGLRGTNLFDLFEDAENGLWIGLQAGITRVDINSPLSILRAGPDDDLSSAYCGAHWFGTMVLGSNVGWYRVVPADPVTAVNAHLERFPETRPFGSACGTVENGMLTITNNQVMLLDADARLVPAVGEIARPEALCVSRLHPGVAYVVDDGGRISVFRLEKERGAWVNGGIVADLGKKGGSFNIAESKSGDLWVNTGENGLFRVQLASGGQAVVTPMLGRPGPLREVRSVQNCGVVGPLRFKSARLICGLDRTGLELRPLAEFGERFRDASLNFGDAMSYDADHLWITATAANDPTGETLRGLATAGNGQRAPTFQPLPHKIEEAVGSYGVFHPMDTPPSPLKTLLLVGTTGNGVVRLDVSQWEAQPVPPPFATLIQRAFTRNPSSSDARPMPILDGPLPYERNSVHFEFAAATMAFGAAPRFQTRLVNFGADGWSGFSDRSSIDYLNLPEGEYVFEVRARNSDGQLGTVASRPFRVLPPWQRTFWAYAAYALTLAGVIAAYIRWRGRRFRRRNAELETLVDARTGQLRARETELVRARDDAESANRAKSAFLANMSHELRTPLNAVLGYAQLLLKQTDLTPRSRERIAVIGQSGGHLLSLVNEVLDLSKVEAGKLTLSLFDFSLHQLLDEVVAAIGPRLVEKGLAFTENRAPGLPGSVYTDPSRLRQVLFNLLGNAAKFTHRGGVILTVRPADEGRVCFEVADTGVGIDPKDLRDIFLAFYQSGESTLASQGTGLGLTISQRLVELLGGRIEVDSTPGQGSRFWFYLPLPAVEPGDGSIPRVVRDPALGKVTGYEGATRRLLIVDDLIENRRVLRDFLQPLGFEIEEAADGNACLAACARQMPDAVLLDLRLGTPDGFEVARLLRAERGGAQPGIIAISASVFESDRQQAIDSGCDDFLPKPFEEAQLLGRLGRLLGLRWVHKTPAVAESRAIAALPFEQATLPADEIDGLREFSLSGDVAGIRRRLDAWRDTGVPGGAGEIVRRLDALVAAYDMEGIHDFLLTIRPHDRN